MNRIVSLMLIATVAALAGCNTWNAAKQDAKEVGGTVTHAVGTGLEKAGSGVEKAGEKVKDAVK